MTGGKADKRVDRSKGKVRTEDFLSLIQRFENPTEVQLDSGSESSHSVTSSRSKQSITSTDRSKQRQSSSSEESGQQQDTGTKKKKRSKEQKKIK